MPKTKVKFEKVEGPVPSFPRHARTPLTEAEDALADLSHFLEIACAPEDLKRELAKLATTTIDSLDEVDSEKITFEEAVARFEALKKLGYQEGSSLLSVYFKVVVVAAAQAMKHYDAEEDALAWTYAIDAARWSSAILTLGQSIEHGTPETLFGVKGANARHALSRDLKKRVRELYRERGYPTKDKAAEEISIELDLKFRTTRNYLRGEGE